MFQYVTIPRAWYSCLSSSKHHAVCMDKFGLDLIKLYGMQSSPATQAIETTSTAPYLTIPIFAPQASKRTSTAPMW